MSLLRSKSNTANVRPSLLVTLKIINKNGDVLDETEAWLALHEAFKNHPTLAVKSAEIAPDKHETSIST